MSLTGCHYLWWYMELKGYMEFIATNFLVWFTKSFCRSDVFTSKAQYGLHSLFLCVLKHNMFISVISATCSQTWSHLQSSRTLLLNARAQGRQPLFSVWEKEKLWKMLENCILEKVFYNYKKRHKIPAH